MFARTTRLLLRPAWAEDAGAFAAMVAEEHDTRLIWKAPRTGSRGGTRPFSGAQSDPVLPSLLIFARTDGAPLLVGSCSLRRRASGRVRFNICLAQAHTGHGLATEAGHALIEIAAALGVSQLDACPAADDPALARVLQKLGFGATGRFMPRQNCAQEGASGAHIFRLSLTERGLAEPLAA